MEESPAPFHVNSIASPMSGPRLERKLLRLSSRLLPHKHVVKGVRDATRAIRKGRRGLLLLAGDVFPEDTISHLPILCESREIPYIFVKSKAELARVAQTRRATAVLFLKEPRGKAKVVEVFAKLSRRISQRAPLDQD